MDATATVQALRELAAALGPSGAVVESLNHPSPLVWIPEFVLAVLTLAAVVLSAVSARAATLGAREASRSTEAARRALALSEEALARDELRALRREFDERDYFMRFWRLDMLTRDPDACEVGDLKIDVCVAGRGHPRTGGVLGPSDLSGSCVNLADVAAGMSHRVGKCALDAIVRDAFGPELSQSRADLLTLYHFALRVASFVKRNPAWGAAAVTEDFGPALVGTLQRHRRLAARLVPETHRREALGLDYYPKAYGLQDERYMSLVASLEAASASHDIQVSESSENVEAASDCATA